MTTVAAKNVGNIAVAGTFDDCQDLVKAMFADAPFRRDLRLSAVNSINWARIAAQVPYYVAARGARRAPDRQVAFAVPPAISAMCWPAWWRGEWDLPIARLVIGSNRNDILTRFPTTNDMSVRGAWSQPCRPSMDIEVSSNFERLLFELLAASRLATGRRCTASARPGG